MNPAIARLCVNTCANCYNPPYQIESTKAHVQIVEMQNTTLVCFRGSKSIEDWIEDGDVRKISVAGYQGRIHQGFWDGVQTIQGELEKRVRMDRPVLMTGHSLGGAQARISAIRFALKGFKIAGLYTFGEPRGGTNLFCRFSNKILSSNHFRFVNESDIVPRIPILLFGWRHSGQRILFTSQSKIKASLEMLGLTISSLPDHHIAWYQSRVSQL